MHNLDKSSLVDDSNTCSYEIQQGGNLDAKIVLFCQLSKQVHKIVRIDTQEDRVQYFSSDKMKPSLY